MGFYGRAFTFDSTPCEMYDLMLYDIGGQDENIPVAGFGSIEEETIGDHWRPYFYGIRHGDKLEFDMTFGVNERRIDAGKFLDRWEISEVTSWLCGHSEYKWLYIDQTDMRRLGYKCLITSLEITQYGSVPWAMKAHVVCDSPYAYLEEQFFQYYVNGQTTFEFLNECSAVEWYSPIVIFQKYGGDGFGIVNTTDDDRGPVFSNIPGSVSKITIDNEHCVVSNNQGLNMYENFNFQFLRLKRGYNWIHVFGNGMLTILCEYPVNVGG